ncbi:MAG TPA: ABC transporter ATP-binding protein [Acidimicrobiales bacterium]|jgi:oligopeptide/dipeptide ABC transporter ATP-binding protein
MTSFGRTREVRGARGAWAPGGKRPTAERLEPEGALKVTDLSVTFRTAARTVEAVRGISFGVEPGRTLVLLGESGSGKSVSARSIMRLYGDAVTVGGQVTFGDVDLLSLPERDMQDVRGRAIALVPQDASGTLDPLRRIGSQIVEVLRRHRIVDSAAAGRERAAELLGQVGLSDPRRAVRAYPHELSGGMRQRALIAIAIACSPRLLIADEPTTALDVTIQAQVLDLFGRLQEELGMGLLFVTHDVGVARQIADRVAVMYAGRLVEDGPGVEVLDRPAHPYTAGLLGAVPTRDTPRGALHAIPGQPPAAGAQTPGACAFAPRCGYALEECGHEQPELVAVGPGHSAACPVMGGRVPVVVGQRPTTDETGQP